MTFTAILSDVYADVNLVSSPAATEVARIKRYVNEGVRVVLGEPGLTRLADSDAPVTVASVANQARYVVPEAVARIMGMSERTNDRTLAAMSLGEYRRREPDPASMSGSPTHYVPFGRTAVAVQPSNASQLLMDSDAAGDTNTAYIETIRTGGLMKSASVAMTGVTAVNIGNSDVIEVTDLYLSAVAVGTVTLVEDASGGTVLATIAIGALRPRYYGFYLWPTPSAAVDYLIDYRRETVELVNDTDEPPLPTDYHYILSAYARMKYYEKTDDTRYGIAKGAFDQALSRLKYATQTGADELPVMGRRRVTGHSRLGGMYPSDTWS
jgi:hypothetical protein